MGKKKVVIEGVELSLRKPTPLSFEQLYHWVIWQFPQLQSNGFAGAVRAPGPEREWLPAIIYFEAKEVQVHAHVGQSFPTPETAAAYFEKEDQPG